MNPSYNAWANAYDIGSRQGQVKSCIIIRGIVRLKDCDIVPFELLRNAFTLPEPYIY